MKFVLITFVALLGSYLTALNSGFLGDDTIRIIGNVELNSLSTALKGSLGDRPLLMFLMWIEWNLFENNPIYFRIVNLALQSLAAHQLYLLILELQDGGAFKKNKRLAFSAALIFALHPIHSQSITIIIQCSVIIAGIFGFFSMRYFFRYLSDPKVHHLSFSVIALALGFLVKPIVAFIPIFYLVSSLMIKGPGIKGKQYLIPYFCTLLIPILLFISNVQNLQVQPISPLAYFLVQTEVIFTYARLIIFPSGLKYLYDFHLPQNLILNIGWLYLAFHISIFLILKKMIKDKAVFLWIIGIYLCFLPESSFFPIDYLAFEHRTYFAVGFFIISMSLLVERLQFRKNIFYSVVAIVIALFIGLNQIRNLQIKSSNRWKIHTLENSESFHHYNFNFAYQLMDQGKWESIGHIIKKYNRLYPQIIRYKILESMYSYYASNKKNKHELEKIAEYLNLNFENTESRRRSEVIRFLVKEIMAKNPSLEDMILFEKILAKQILIFRSNQLEFGKWLNYYEILASTLLGPNFEKNYAFLDRENYLKTKAIMQFYFNKKYPRLGNEITKELNKSPDSYILKRIDKMINSKI
jgi:hypothetical protein